MNQAIIKQLLARAQGYVTQGERHVARQREIIAEKQRHGYDAAMSMELLKTFEQSLALHRADRDQLIKEASKASPH